MLSHANTVWNILYVLQYICMCVFGYLQIYLGVYMMHCDLMITHTQLRMPEYNL